MSKVTSHISKSTLSTIIFISIVFFDSCKLHVLYIECSVKSYLLSSHENRDRFRYAWRVFFSKIFRKSGVIWSTKWLFLGIDDPFELSTIFLRSFSLQINLFVYDPYPLPTFGSPIIKIFFVIVSSIPVQVYIFTLYCRSYDYDYFMNEHFFSENGSIYQMQINVMRFELER